MAETSKSYDNSRKALNDQIDAISNDLTAQKDRINAQYAQQGKNLDNQRNWQAQASSMAASRNGGSFGGANEIANKKYYQQAFVPAVTQMQTNQANDLSSAESQANQNRLSLQQTLAQLNDEASRYGMQRYDAAVQAERDEAYRQAQLALQRQQIAQQNALNNLLYGGKSGYGYQADDNGGLQFYNTGTGNKVKFGTYYASKGGNFTNNDLLNNIRTLFGANSNEYRTLANMAARGATFSQNTGSNYRATDNDLLNRLGLSYSYSGPLALLSGRG